MEASTSVSWSSCASAFDSATASSAALARCARSLDSAEASHGSAVTVMPCVMYAASLSTSART